ncbi:hypothetical protein PUG42_27125 [Erwiniaceae bacterium L1_54_3]|uniref:hypothetical protein n=1 Tax=Candidatus Pantoea formicae TaxID=2608355 RepID=UPI00196684D6|nr:hypothetical protein [Pantoea formicae]MDF7652214.1 hypothetical protein [Erwiniaceae bacterium L1_54_3]
MISKKRLSQIAENPDGYDAEVVAMAQELLQLRRTLGAPWAVVQPLGELYVEDGNAAMIWPASLAERGDVCLYRLEKPSPGVDAAPPAAKQRGRRKKLPAPE